MRWIGGTTNALLRGRGTEAKGTIPHVLFMAYQGTFAIITAALISGAIVERMRFGPYLAFIALWTLFVYAPVAHWVWGGGWLMSRGVLDFAGGTVVHINAGVSALVAALVLGARKDYSRQAILPHNVPFVLLGAGLLWFGWFGFNGGSALAANELRRGGLHQHLPRPDGHAGGLGAARLLPHRPRHRGRRRHRHRDRPRRHHAGRRLHQPDRARCSSAPSPRSRATSPSWPGRAPGWTTRSTCSPATASAASPARSSPACSRPRCGTRRGADGLLAGNPAQLGTQALGVRQLDRVLRRSAPS